MGPCRLKVLPTLTVLNIYTLFMRYLSYNLASLIWIYFVFQNISERDISRHLTAIRINCLAIEILFPCSSTNIRLLYEQRYVIPCVGNLTGKNPL